MGFKVRVFTLLERPRDKFSLFYHALSALFTLASVLLTVLATTHAEQVAFPLYYLEVFIFGWLLIEFLLRIWSAGCKSQHHGLRGRYQLFKTNPLLFVDLISILASAAFILRLVALDEVSVKTIGLQLHWFRFFEFFRMFRIDRRAETWAMLGRVVGAHWHELAATGYIGLILLLITSFTVFVLEHGDNLQFSSWADSLWWTLITFYSVGYGDMSPSTWQGKLATCMLATLGIIFFLLPAGILGSGFALKAQEQKRESHMEERRIPAAGLIQSMWRLRVASDKPLANGVLSKASWPTQILARRGSRRPMTSKLVKAGSRAVTPGVTLAVQDLEAVPPNKFELTQQIRGAVLMLRRIKYFAQKKQMKKAMRPYDVMDIVESYSAGHNDLVATVKQMKKQVVNIESCLTRLIQALDEEEKC